MDQDLKVGNINFICVVKYSMLHSYKFCKASSGLPSSNFIDCFQSQNI